MAILFPMPAKKGKFIEILWDSWVFPAEITIFAFAHLPAIVLFKGKLADWW